MTYYERYTSNKETYVFTYSFLKKVLSGARVVRRSKRYSDKALPPNVNHNEDHEGIVQSWTTAPPIKELG